MPMSVQPHSFAGVFFDPEIHERLFTTNLIQGVHVRDEKIIYDGGVEYREWNPFHSKLAAAILRGIQNMPVLPNQTGLYLGASSGTTVSHVSDIIGTGVVFALEFAPRSLRELIQNCDQRYNVIPILGDATKPAQYRQNVVGLVDFLYEDVAQPTQSKILFDNAQFFLQDGGLAFLAIKSRSIDVAEEPEKIYQQEIHFLENHQFEILELVTLEPFSADHAVLIGRYHQ